MTQKTRETRIGLVLYGGVSLAVYINGVTQEFYHAVQGNGVYNLIKELTDSEIVLDIVSGSSAGGINGILLAYALANGRDFTRSQEMWRDSADISRLLRKTTPTDGPVPSVLDSEGYYQSEMERAFRTLDGTTAPAEAPSPLQELDLFVTGTDIDGLVSKRVDDAGHVIEVKDHRTVFHLKYRKDRKSNFDSRRNSAVSVALAKLARITSCFPGAFAPVFVSHSAIEGKNQDQMSDNELLQYWGALPRPVYLIDGGVIDNKPFSYTTHEIFFRTADRKVDRKLFYVEPDPERFAPTDPELPSNPPSFLKPIISSLVTIPGYESIADDLKRLSIHNESIRQYQQVMQDVVKAPKGELGEPQRSIYFRARYASLSDRVLKGMIKNAKFNNSTRQEAQRAALMKEFDRSQSDPDAEVLRDFDIFYRLRRTFNLTYHVYDLLHEPPKGTALTEHQTKRYNALLIQLNTHVERLDILRSAMQGLVDEVDYGWDDDKNNDPVEVWKKVAYSLRQLLRSDGLRNSLNNLETLNGKLHDRISQIKGSIFDPPNFRSILLDVDDVASALLSANLEENDPVLDRYRSFEFIDAHVFPIEWLSGLREKDVIEIYRVSPVDAQTGFSERPASDKTCGDSLAHFAGFFKRTWRSNDIMWGRLDGVCELIQTLMTKESLLQGMQNRNSRARARAALFPPNGSSSPIDRWFKNCSEAAVEDIRLWAMKITDPNDVTSEEAANEFPGSIRELLTEMAQFQILNEALPNVFQDSIAEQVQWKQLRRPDNKEPGKLKWIGSDVSVDGTALQAIASVGGQQLLDDLSEGRPTEKSPRSSPLGQKFGEFTIGREEVLSGGLPPLVVADLTARALLVLRNCLVGSLPGNGSKFRATTLYRWGIDLPLNAFHGMVRLLKSAPGAEMGIFIGLSIISAMALFVGLRWKDAIVQPNGQFSVLWFSVFIFVPAAWLCVGFYQISRTHIRSNSFTESTRHALIAICAASPLISVGLVYFGFTNILWDWYKGTPGAAEPTSSRYLQATMIVLFGIVPFVLSFLGGYLAVRQANREVNVDDLEDALKRISESELQDISDRMGELHRVTLENRLDIVKGLMVSAEMNQQFGRLERAIRATSPDVLN